MKEFYIDDQLVDIQEKDEPIAMTFQANNVDEVGNRKANISNTFLIPWSENNRRILGLPDMASIRDLSPYRPHKAKLLQNGLELISNGYSEIDKVYVDGIQMLVYDSIVNFFETISVLKLSDLNLTAYDHFWNRETIRASQANTEGYKYPFIDYGGFPNPGEDGKTVISTLVFRPAFFVKTLVDLIIRQQGYTYSGEFTSDPRYQRELIAFSNEHFSKPLDFDYAHFGVVSNRSTEVSYHVSFTLTNYISVPDEISDPSNSYEEVTESVPPNTFTYTRYTAQEALNVSATYRFDVTYSAHVSGITVDVPGFSLCWQIWKAGEGWSDIVDSRKQFNAGAFDVEKTDTNQTVQANVLLLPGQRIRIKFYSFNPSADTSSDVSIHAGSSVEIKAESTDLSYGEGVSMAANLPDMNQKDFLKDVMQRYCLTPIVDNDRKHIQFKHFRELYARKSDAVDWTRKFLADQPEVYYKLSDEYGQVNYGKYKEDDTVPADLGTGSFPIDNTTMDGESTILTSVFAASEISVKYGHEMALIPMIEEPNFDENKFDFSGKVEPRLLLDVMVEDPSLYLKGTASGDEETSIANPMISTPVFTGLSYQELFDAYYREFQRMLVFCRKERHQVMLNEVDLAQLDFFRPVYDGRAGQYYYINLIDDYIEGEPATAELIRM